MVRGAVSLACAAAAFALVALVAAPTPTHAWGLFGHQAVGAIAQKLIAPTTNKEVTRILEGRTLKEVSKWADYVRHLPGWEWMFPLHFVDQKDRACDYQYTRDCHYEGIVGRCVVAAIANYTVQVATPEDKFTSVFYPEDPSLTSGYQADEDDDDLNPSKITARNAALRFITHLLADIHQPLHTGFLGDEGGNLVNVTFFKTPDVLHSVWDDELIDRAINTTYKHNFDHWVDDLVTRITAGEYKTDVPTWTKCVDGTSLACVGTFAAEGTKLACTNAYECLNESCTREGVVEHPDLGEEYFGTNIKVVNYRIAQAGVRLAAILDNIFSDS